LGPRLPTGNRERKRKKYTHDVAGPYQAPDFGGANVLGGGDTRQVVTKLYSKHEKENRKVPDTRTTRLKGEKTLSAEKHKGREKKNVQWGYKVSHRGLKGSTALSQRKNKNVPRKKKHN